VGEVTAVKTPSFISLPPKAAEMEYPGTGFTKALVRV
jgi:hypothetical protein